jgi:hypothetical protein
MAKTGIRLYYTNGGPESITNINCGNSEKDLGGTVRLTSFTNLTAFQGGDNNLNTIIGTSNLTALKSFEITGTNTVAFNLNTLPINLDYFDVRGSNRVSGNYTSLPSNLTYFNLQGSNTASGSVINLPRNLLYCEHSGSGNKTGTLTQLPTGIQVLKFTSSTTLAGELTGMPASMVEFDVRSNSTVFGDISAIPHSTKLFRYWGNGILVGVLSSLKPGLELFSILSPNTIGGNIEDIPDSLNHMIVRGSNQIRGNVENFSPTSNLELLRLTSSSSSCSISGNVTGLPRTLKDLEIGQFSVLSGSVVGLPPNLESLEIGSFANRHRLSGTLTELPSSLKSLIIFTGQNTLSGSINDLPSSMEVYRWFMNTTLVGDISAMPRTIRTTVMRGGSANVVTGNIQFLPPNLQLIDMAQTGNRNTLYGDISAMPKTITSFNIGGQNTITGDISKIHNGIIGLVLQGQNTIYGNFSNLPKTMTGGFRLIGNNRVFGSIDNLPNLNMFDIRGNLVANNLRTGDIKNLPNSLTTFRFENTTLTGDISALKPGITNFRVVGSNSNNTITGNVGLLPSSCTIFDVRNNNTVYGNLSTVPSGTTRFRIIGNSRVYSYYDGTDNKGYFKRTWTSPMNQIQLQPGLLNSNFAGMPEEHLVTLLVDLSTVNWQGTIITSIPEEDQTDEDIEGNEPRILYADINNPAIFNVFYPEASAARTAILNKGTDVRVNLISAVPTFYRDFAKYNTLDHGGALSGAPITFTRASTATYIDVNGGLKYAAIDEPRIEKNGLLIERESSNLLRHSQDFTNPVWTRSGDRLTIVPNAGIAPDGTMTATLLSTTPVSGTQNVEQSISVTPGAIYSMSVFVKKAGISNIIRLRENTTDQLIIAVDLNTGEITSTRLDLYNRAGQTPPYPVENYKYTVTPAGSGWYRITATGPTTGNTWRTEIRLNRNEVIDRDVEFIGEDGVKSAYVWGAQLEALQGTTSYIPTTTLSATRATDTAQVLDVSSFYNQNEGTILASGYAPMPGASTAPNSSHRRLIDFTNSTNNQNSLISMGRTGNNIVRFAVENNSSSIVRLSAVNEFSNLDYFKAVFGYQLNNYVGYVGSTLAQPMVGLSGTIVPSNITTMNIGHGFAGPNRWLNGHVGKIMYFPTRLSNTEVQQISL